MPPPRKPPTAAPQPDRAAPLVLEHGRRRCCRPAAVPSRPHPYAARACFATRVPVAGAPCAYGPRSPQRSAEACGPHRIRPRGAGRPSDRADSPAARRRLSDAGTLEPLPATRPRPQAAACKQEFAQTSCDNCEQNVIDLHSASTSDVRHRLEAGPDECKRAIGADAPVDGAAGSPPLGQALARAGSATPKRRRVSVGCRTELSARRHARHRRLRWSARNCWSVGTGAGTHSRRGSAGGTCGTLSRNAMSRPTPATPSATT